MFGRAVAFLSSVTGPDSGARWGGGHFHISFTHFAAFYKKEFKFMLLFFGYHIRVVLPDVNPSLPIPGPVAPGEGEPIMCAAADESGMRRGGGRERLCRLILGELLCPEKEEGDFLPLPPLEEVENVARDGRVPCSELLLSSRSLGACAPRAVSNSSPVSPPTPPSHVQQASIVHLESDLLPRSKLLSPTHFLHDL